MDVKIHIPFQQLVALVRRLTPRQKARLRQELAEEKRVAEKPSRLTSLLLSGPTLTAGQIKAIEETRKSIGQWRTGA